MTFTVTVCMFVSCVFAQGVELNVSEI